MRSILSVIILAALFCTLLSSCSNNAKPSESASNTTSAPASSEASSDKDMLDEAMPEPFETAGDELAFYFSGYNHSLLNFPSEIVDLAGKDEFEKWTKNFELGLRDKADCNILCYIKEFKIPEDSFRAAVVANSTVAEGQYNDEWTLTSDDVDIIYSGDAKLINSTYKNEYALIHNEDIYSPEWLYTHSTAAYEAHGLTVDEVQSCFQKMKDFPFTEEALQAIDNKAESYK